MLVHIGMVPEAGEVAQLDGEMFSKAMLEATRRSCKINTYNKRLLEIHISNLLETYGLMAMGDKLE